MQAQMITDFFQYQPCELRAEGSALRISFAGARRTMKITSIKEAALNRDREGVSRLTLTSENGRYEFLLDERQTEENAAALLYDLTKNNARVELRTL